jgi:hypothetical protein
LEIRAGHFATMVSSRPLGHRSPKPTSAYLGVIWTSPDGFKGRYRAMQWWLGAGNWDERDLCRVAPAE